MRLNLLLTVALMGLIAFSSLLAAQPTNLRWKQTCVNGVSFTIWSGGNYSQRLEIENDRYRVCDHSSTSSEVRERGFVGFEGESLTLVSDHGKRTKYRLAEAEGKWFLSDPKGKAHGQELESQPRLHPSPEWLDKGMPLELDAPPPRPPVQIPHIQKVKSGSETSFFPRVEMPEINSDLGGSRLIQGGRDLLNRRSSRRDVESLFGPLNWTVVDGPTNHGTSAEARRGKLLIRVHGIVGTTPDEATVTGFSLEDGATPPVYRLQPTR